MCFAFVSSYFCLHVKCTLLWQVLCHALSVPIRTTHILSLTYIAYLAVEFLIVKLHKEILWTVDPCYATWRKFDKLMPLMIGLQYFVVLFLTVK